MLIRLRPTQISLLWEDIKYSAIQANNIPQHNQGAYANKLLENLLSAKFQCWIVFDFNEENNRQIHAIGITTIIEDNISGLRTLEILSLYGYRTLTDVIAMEGMRDLKEFARKHGCLVIKASTNVQRIKNLAKLTRFEPKYETFELEV